MGLGLGLILCVSRLEQTGGREHKWTSCCHRRWFRCCCAITITHGCRCPSTSQSRSYSTSESSNQSHSSSTSSSSRCCHSPVPLFFFFLLLLFQFQFQFQFLLQTPRRLRRRRHESVRQYRRCRPFSSSSCCCTTATTGEKVVAVRPVALPSVFRLAVLLERRLILACRVDLTLAPASAPLFAPAVTVTAACVRRVVDRCAFLFVLLLLITRLAVCCSGGEVAVFAVSSKPLPAPVLPEPSVLP